jgi:hypothetical protein
MSTKPVAFRLDEELLAQVGEFQEFVNKGTKFPARSRTDVVHFLLRKGLEAAMTPTPPKRECVQAFAAANRRAGENSP